MSIRLGVRGEFKVRILSKLGEVRHELPWQDNLITNSGLDFLCFNNAPQRLFSETLDIGQGNVEPTNSDTSLSVFLKNIRFATKTKALVLDEVGNTLTSTVDSKFVFNTGIANKNISELGVKSDGSGVIFTRALIKDSLGNPTTITPLEGEILEVVYRVHAVYSTIPTTAVITDTESGNTFNTSTMIADVTNEETWNNCVDSPLAPVKRGTSNGQEYLYFSNAGISNIDTSPRYNSGSKPLTPIPPNLIFSSYVAGTHKRIVTIKIQPSLINDWAVDGIKSVTIQTTLGLWQTEYTNTATGKGILKTDKHRLEIPFEFSVGRL